MFNFLTNINTEIGNGSFSNFINKIQEMKLGKILFIIDEGFAKGEYWIEQKNKLKRYDDIYIKYFQGINEPTYDDLEKMLIEAKEINPDTIVSCGGGSCMDISKAIAALIKNNGDALSYKGFDKLKNPGIKTVLIPTTAGTGSESSYNASFVDTINNKKMGINGKFMFATKSILDANTLISCPKKVLLGSAVDALTHSLEGFICKNSNEYSDMLSFKAFEYIINNISKIANIDLNSGLELLKGAHLGGIIQMNSGSGIAAAISYPLSVYFKVPHGIGGGIFLLGIMKFNIENGIDKYDKLIPYLDKKNVKNSLDLLKYLQELFDKIGVPKNLSEYGIYKKNKNKLCEIMNTQQIAFDQNPVKFSVVDNFPNFIENYLE